MVQLKSGAEVVSVRAAAELAIQSPHKFRSKNLPAAGGIIKLGEVEELPNTGGQE